MQQTDLITHLKEYFAQSVLDGRDVGLDETTPLLEWGIINSLEIVRLLSFIQKEFAVEIPMGELTAEHFVSIAAIADMIIECQTT